MNAKKTIANPRHLAVVCAEMVEQKGMLVSEAMNSLRLSLSDEDRQLAHEIVYGSFRRLPGLNIMLAALCKPAGLPPKIRWLLLTSLYQMKFMRTPSYAVVDQAVRLAAALKFGGLKALVNGVLRNADRRAAELGADLDEVRLLLPPWMAELFADQYGAEEVARWCASWEGRAQTSYWTVDDAGLEGDTRSDSLPHAWRRGGPIPADAFETRQLYVQNESSQAISELAARLKPDSVLDVCAAPGGKSCYLAAFAQPARLVANDVSSRRVARLRENRDRLGLNFELMCADALEADFGSFDLVLLDAPCTGIGIIGRHPEIKMLKTTPADAGLRASQAALAAAAWRAVAPGGYLLYTVCSLDRNEVPEMPADALPVPLDGALGEGLPLHAAGAGFFAVPDQVFDGFRGVLVQKPANS